MKIKFCSLARESTLLVNGGTDGGSASVALRTALYKSYYYYYYFFFFTLGSKDPEG